VTRRIHKYIFNHSASEVAQRKTCRHFNDLDPTPGKLQQALSQSHVPLSSTHRFKPAITLRTATTVLWHSRFEIELMTNNSQASKATGNEAAIAIPKYKPFENSL